MLHVKDLLFELGKMSDAANRLLQQLPKSSQRPFASLYTSKQLQDCLYSIVDRNGRRLRRLYNNNNNNNNNNNSNNNDDNNNNNNDNNNNNRNNNNDDNNIDDDDDDDDFTFDDDDDDDEDYDLIEDDDDDDDDDADDADDSIPLFRCDVGRRMRPDALSKLDDDGNDEDDDDDSLELAFSRGVDQYVLQAPKHGTLQTFTVSFLLVCVCVCVSFFHYQI
jgi:hypothetical protein